MESHFPDERAERVQRTLNQAKRNELTDRYGMNFSPTPNDLPADLEAEFLASVEEFERRWEEASTTTVRAFLGNPDILHPADVPARGIPDELARITEIMNRRNVHLDFICPVPDAEAYRFIVEELLDHEMEDIPIEGMIHGFIYEEFHPNHLYDVSSVGRDVAEGLLLGNEWKVDLYCAEILRVGQVEGVSREDLRLRLVAATTGGAVVTSVASAVGPCAVDGTEGSVEVEAGWEGVMLETGETKGGRVRWRMELMMRDGYGWVVTAITPDP